MGKFPSFVAIVVACITTVHTYPDFPNRIPNGNRMPHPCKPNYIWYGVGHMQAKGGGALNAFGEAFKKWGYEWNTCLCHEDSDGDGRTNGEELGDPRCVWEFGTTPERTRDITHPGICDPFESQECQGRNDWVECSSESDITCDAMKEPDVINFTLTYPKTKVPAQETTYMCKTFNLTSLLPPGDSHIIGNTVSLDNKEVMHHAVIYACPDSSGQAIMEEFEDPKECGMATKICQDMIGLWTVGMDSTCLNENMGFPVGTNGYKILLLEYHWNNPELKEDYTDASGLTLFVKSNKRQYDAGVWFLGPPLVHVPPGFQSYVNYGGCNSACTHDMMDSTIYITSIIPHMHYLGKAFKFRHLRNGTMLYEFQVDHYMYDTPHVEAIKTPLEVHPGDNFKLECVYQSTNKKNFTFWGLSTQEEMCYAVMIYYPFQKDLTYCETHDGYGFCNRTLRPNPFIDQGGSTKCNFTSFNEVVDADTDTILQNCDPNGMVCYPECETAIYGIAHNPCWTGPAQSSVMTLMYWYYNHGIRLLVNIGSCLERPPVDGVGGGNSLCDQISSAEAVYWSFPVFLLSIVVLFVVLLFP